MISARSIHRTLQSGTSIILSVRNGWLVASVYVAVMKPASARLFRYVGNETIAQADWIARPVKRSR